MKKYFLIIIPILLSLFILAYLYISKSSQSSTQLETINLQLKWLHQAQFAGHYVADQNGFYKEQGLSVNIKPFDYSVAPIDAVISGQADYGVAGADELLIAQSEGKDVVAIAVIFQKSPVVAYSLSSSDIKTPQDFKNKRVGIEPVANIKIPIYAMLKNIGLDPAIDMEIIEIDYDASALINGEVDVATGYEINEAIQPSTFGLKVNIIAPYEYGINSYGDILFTTRDRINNNPEQVQKFVSATLKGWEHALANIEEATEIILTYDDPNNNALSYDHQFTMLTQAKTLIKPTPIFKIGAMNYSTWRETYHLLFITNLLEKELKVDQAFTTRFIK